MHDPMTVIGDFPSYKARKRWPWLPHLFTLWHVDPEKDGTDSSCWNYCRQTPATDAEKAIAEVLWDGETMFDNRPHYPDSREHRWFQQLKAAWWEHRRRKGWCLSWRWHFWHWKVQFHPWQVLRRWLLTRCCRCGKRFPWGYAPCTSHWDAPPLRWFRGEEGLYHHDCHDQKASRLTTGGRGN